MTKIEAPARPRALVTGAAGGIGRHAARLLAASGAQVTLADVANAAVTKESNARWLPDAACIQCDSSDRAAVEDMAARLGPLDILVDAGGICPRDDWMAPDWDATFERVVNVNVRGPINLARAFMPGMIERKYGRIVLCGSLAGWTGGLITSPHYAAAKGGVHALVRWLACRATPHGVCVNGVAPGPVESDMTAGVPYDVAKYPQGRLGRTDEIAEVIAFLASPGASHIAGSVLDVNGGIFMR